MDTFTLILILGGCIILINIVVAFLLFSLFKKKPEPPDPSLKEGLGFLQKELQDVRRTFDTRIGETARDINASVKTQLTESTKIVREVTEGLTKLGETNKQVVGFAEQLKQLSDVLKNPKQRGVLGEYYLEAVLQNVLPPKTFVMQYSFENGDIVDAAIFVKDKVIPVDSKFSLENYNRFIQAQSAEEKTTFEQAFKQDLKKRIDETGKYVRPNEGTLEFAFMFIPSEGVYYDILIGTGNAISAQDLIKYAFSKKVIIVSPTSFLAYLQTVLQGLKAMQIEESAKEIRARVEDLGRHIGKWEEYYQKIGSTLATTVNHYNAGYKEMGKIDKDVLKITGTGVGVTPTLLQKPEEE
ncbi:MAG: hypothetical protein RI911_205 [Candidatus Parcubacteria bacterium]|jgi:DNA recombination protein RmuC